MNSDSSTPSHDLPVYDAETDTVYSIDVIAKLAGVKPQTVLHYQERGFIRPAARSKADAALFDVECLRQLRRIVHLRAICEIDDTGLKLVLDLLHETERLRDERRKFLR